MLKPVIAPFSFLLFLTLHIFSCGVAFAGVKPADAKPLKLDGKLAAWVNQDNKYPYLDDVFWYFDLDANGLKDFVMCASYGGNGIPTDEVIVLLQVQPGKFRRVDYSTYGFEIGDFRDFNADGKYEVVISSLMFAEKSLDGKAHSYWVYAVYRIEDFALKMANGLAPGFPKFNWFTEKPNDKETGLLSPVQKAGYIATLPSVITSAAISN